MDNKVNIALMPGQAAPGQTGDSQSPISPRARRRRRRSGWVWLFLLLVLAAIAGGGWYAWKTWVATDATRERVATATVQRGDLEDAITATGTLQPRDFVDVGTQVSGQLKVLKVQIGDAVKAGDLLAEIDPTVFQSRVDADQAQLRNQQAQLRDKQSQLALAELQQERQRGLMKENATTAEALQSVEASVKSINAQIEAIRAQMQQTESSLRGNEANLGYTKIYAPMAGTVASLPTKQGQTLNANQQAPVVMRIADLSVMTVQAQVSEADVPKLKVDMEVYFTTLGGDTRRWYGTLRQINPTPTVVNNVVLYDALFDVPNTTRELMTQMTAQVFFIAASARDAVFVPITALRPAGGGRRAAAAKGESAKTSEATVPKAEIAKTENTRIENTRTENVKTEIAEASKGNPDQAKGAVEQKSERRRGEGKSSAEGKAARSEGKGGAEGKAGRGEGKGGVRSVDVRPGTDPRTLFANGRATVRVAREDGTFEEREVRIGMMNRVSAQILDGLQPGEQVQISGGGRGTGGPGGGKGPGAPKFAPRI